MATQTWAQLASQGIEGDTGMGQPQPLALPELSAAADPLDSSCRLPGPFTQESESLIWTGNLQIL